MAKGIKLGKDDKTHLACISKERNMIRLFKVAICLATVLALTFQASESNAAAVAGVSPAGNFQASPAVYTGGPLPVVTSIPIANDVFPPGINDIGSAIATITVSDAIGGGSPHDGVSYTPGFSWAVTNTGPLAVDLVTFTLSSTGAFAQLLTFGAPGVPAGWTPTFAGPNKITYAGLLSPGNTVTFSYLVNMPAGQPIALDNLEMNAKAVPEPSSWALGGLGIAMMAGWGWRRRRKQGDTAKKSA